MYPDRLASDNLLGYLSDDDGKTYNTCHCELLVNPDLTSLTLALLQSGVISKSPTWTSIGVNRTWITSNILTGKEVSIMRYDIHCQP
jgi:hypothetical protein